MMFQFPTHLPDKFDLNYYKKIYACFGSDYNESGDILLLNIEGGNQMNEPKPIMVFKVYADSNEVSNLECPYGAVTMIPFSATVESELFTGKTLPGAVDVQIENPGKSRNMCAKYMFRGTDKEGNPCQLFVKNDSYLAPIMRGEPFFDGCPMFLTDSPVLGEYLCGQHFRSEVQGYEWGVEIRIYDVLIK